MYLCFSGIPVESRVNIFINSFGSIQETTMVTHTYTNTHTDVPNFILILIYIFTIQRFHLRCICTHKKVKNQQYTHSIYRIISVYLRLRSFSFFLLSCCAPQMSTKPIIITKAVLVFCLCPLVLSCFTE